MQWPGTFLCRCPLLAGPTVLLLLLLSEGIFLLAQPRCHDAFPPPSSPFYDSEPKVMILFLKLNLWNSLTRVSIKYIYTPMYNI